MSARAADGFSGRTALVTGGASGIGAALTRALVAAGARVYCTDLDGAAAARVADTATGPGTASGAALDVTDAPAVQEAVDGVIADAGRLDVLFNNAGILFGGPTELLTLAQWNAIIDVNLRGVVHGVAAAYPHMIAARRGQIVNMASLAGLVPGGLLTSYIATKHAVVGLSLGLRAEALAHGVGVTVVCPGVVETPILDKGAVGGFEGREFFLGGGGAKEAYPADRLAQDVLSGVSRNHAMVVAPGNARVAWRIARMSPAFTQRMGARSVARRQGR